MSAPKGLSGCFIYSVSGRAMPGMLGGAASYPVAAPSRYQMPYQSQGDAEGLEDSGKPLVFSPFLKAEEAGF